MSRLVTITLLLSPFFMITGLEAQARPPKAACISNTTGVITLRRRCRTASETTLSRSSYANPDNDLSTRITDISTSIDLLKSTSDGHTADITALESATNTNTASISDNSSDISSLTTTAASHSTTIAGHTASINSLTTTTASHSTTLAGQTASISTLNTSVSSHTTTLTTHGTDIASNAASIADLQPASVYMVAVSGAPYATVAEALTAAIDAGASASNPALIKIAPGAYEISSMLSVLPGITIQGSGIDRTFLQGTGAILIQLTSNTALSDLTVRKTSGTTGLLLNLNGASRVLIQDVTFRDSAALADRVISMEGCADCIFKDVTVEYSGGSDNAIAIFSHDSAPAFYRLNASCAGNDSCRTLLAQGTGIISIHDSYLESSDSVFGATAIQLADNTSLRLMNSRLKADSNGTFGAVTLALGSTGGAQIIGSTAECSGSANAAPCILSDGNALVEISTSRVRTDDASEPTVSASAGAVRIVSTVLDNGDTQIISGGSITCAGVTDESLNFMASSCP